MNDFLTYLKRRIENEGPLTVADYMAECLMNPKYGYYQRETVFGEQGDFITAPEISQMFGEMLGLWVVDTWTKLGSPENLNLIELGPGRGTLMADMLRIFVPAPKLQETISIHFVETSTQLRALQANVAPNASWHNDLSTLPDGPSIFIANEFFDALPIQQFEKVSGDWFERRIAADGDSLLWVLTPASSKLALADAALLEKSQEGILEISSASISVMGDIATHIKAHGGAALIIDYGYDKADFGDTLQALMSHQFQDVLDNPGKADITAHVNFENLKTIGEELKLQTAGPIGQGHFLMQLGMGQRAEQLDSGRSDDSVLKALVRLTDPKEMGELFRVLAIANPPIDLAGFTP